MKENTTPPDTTRTDTTRSILTVMQCFRLDFRGGVSGDKGRLGIFPLETRASSDVPDPGQRENQREIRRNRSTIHEDSKTHTVRKYSCGFHADDFGHGRDNPKKPLPPLETSHNSHFLRWKSPKKPRFLNRRIPKKLFNYGTTVGCHRILGGASDG